MNNAHKGQVNNDSFSAEKQHKKTSQQLRNVTTLFLYAFYCLLAIIIFQFSLLCNYLYFCFYAEQWTHYRYLNANDNFRM